MVLARRSCHLPATPDTVTFLVRMSSQRSRLAGQTGLRWYQSLQFKLGLLFAVLLAFLGGVAFYAGQRLIGTGLDRATFRHEMAINGRIGAELRQITSSADGLAQALALIAAEPPSPARSQIVERLGEHLGAELPIIGIGLWPEPASTAAGSRRNSQFWRVLSGGSNGIKLELRDDYNAASAIPYWREPWYVAARIAGSGRRCLWSAPYRDPLLDRDVVSCAASVDGPRGFEGVTTVVIDLDALATRFAGGSDNNRSYALLADRDGRLLALSPLARSLVGKDAAASRSLADLAKRDDRYNALALAVHQRLEAFRADALRSSRYDARQVSSLKDNSRDLSRRDAEDTLAAIWNRDDRRAIEPAVQLSQPEDPVLREDAYLVLSTLPDTGWQLVSVSPSREGQDTTVYLITEALVLTLGTSALVLVIAFALLRRAVIRPLRQMTRELAAAESNGDGLAVTLDESTGSELGLLAYWHNERSARLREMQDRASIAAGQLAGESAERVRAQEALLRLAERNGRLLDGVDEGVIVLDDQGRIDDINTVAEQWLNASARSLRSQPFSAVFAVRSGPGDSPALPDLWRQLIETGARIEHPEGVWIGTGGAGTERELGLTVLPVMSRLDRLTGALILLRRQGQAVRSGRGDGTAEADDPVTGLAGRRACERRISAVQNQALAQAQARAGAASGAAPPVTQVLVKIDLPVLRQVRGRLGMAEADTLAASSAERLAALMQGAERVFRMTPDRFAVLLEASDEASARAVAEALRAEISEQRLLAGPDWVELDAGLGLCLIDPTVESATEIMRRAGIACDHTRNGPRVVLYDPSQENGNGAAEEELWVQRIERGLEHHLFHLTTQSVQPARSHVVDGEVFEALLSLEDEEGFWAPPSVFLPVAERHLLGSRLDRWVIRELFARLSNDAPLCGGLSFCGINLSADSLGDPGLIDYIAEQMNSHPQVPVAKLCFELRDDMLANQPLQAQRFCAALRKLGARIAIDQRVGRQISVIDQLRQLPIDILKLDSKQFAKIADDSIDQTLAETAMRLARIVGSWIIVTQIETEALATVWRRLGADYLQGHAIAKPSPVPFRV